MPLILDHEQVAKSMDRDNYMSVSEAIAYGIIDGIEPPKCKAASVKGALKPIVAKEIDKEYGVQVYKR